jgi:hypothetical protein
MHYHPFNRKSSDRRSGRTPLFSRYLFRGRRRDMRRAEETGAGYYVDRFTFWDSLPAIALVALSIADLILTAAWLRSGGEEANPAMAWLIARGGFWFSLVKIGLTLFAAAFFLTHARFARARAAAGAMIVLYTGLLIYHSWLFGQAGVDMGGAVARLVR